MDKHPTKRLDIAIRVAFVLTVSFVIWRWPKAITVTPSFDCSKATLPTERVICTDPGLAKVDVDFAIYYADNLATAAINGDGAIVAALVKGQRDFTTIRDRCGTNKLCVMEVYGDRESKLKAMSGLPAPDFLNAVNVY